MFDQGSNDACNSEKEVTCEHHDIAVKLFQSLICYKNNVSNDTELSLYFCGNLRESVLISIKGPFTVFRIITLLIYIFENFDSK